MNVCRCGITTPRQRCYFCARTPWRVCDALMPTYGDRCARGAGHKNDHRSKYALKNASRMRSGRGLRQWIAA